jgi:hypothetical protein
MCRPLLATLRYRRTRLREDYLLETLGYVFVGLSALAPWVVLAGLFLGRHWILARIEKGLQHGFDRRLEELRGELRVSEERLKSTLRDRESEITLLRNTVLTGIRMNSGGTVLSYSDLLFSIAVANWHDLDARREVNGLVETLNGTGNGFAFSKDFVLKAGLMLAEIKSVGFKVENFDKANMATLEATWPAISRALGLTTQLVSDFGFSGQTLRADSALLPIAYYLYKKKLPTIFLPIRGTARIADPSENGWPAPI